MKTPSCTRRQRRAREAGAPGGAPCAGRPPRGAAAGGRPAHGRAAPGASAAAGAVGTLGSVRARCPRAPPYPKPSPSPRARLARSCDCRAGAAGGNRAGAAAPLRVSKAPGLRDPASCRLAAQGAIAPAAGRGLASGHAPARGERAARRAALCRCAGAHRRPPWLCMSDTGLLGDFGPACVLEAL